LPKAVYGSFKTPGTDYFEDYNPKFLARIKEVELEAVSFLKVMESNAKTAPVYPYLEIIKQNIDIAISRYFNDLIRLKVMHTIDGMHRTKIAAYTTKWINLNPIIVSTVSFDDLNKMSDEARKLSYNVSYMFINHMIRHFIPPNESLDIERYKLIRHQIIYNLKTGSYEAHLAANLLETIDPINGSRSD